MPLRRKRYKLKRRRAKVAETSRLRQPDASQPSPVDCDSGEILARLTRIETGYSELDRLLAEMEKRLPDPEPASPPNKPR